MDGEEDQRDAGVFCMPRLMYPTFASFTLKVFLIILLDMHADIVVVCRFLCMLREILR